MSGKIVLSGYYGFNNAGDEAILTAIVNSIRSKIADVELVVISGNPKRTSIRNDVISIHRFNFIGIIKNLLNSDLLISGGGSLLQDVTSIKSLLYYLTIIFLGHCCSKNVMLYAQGIGPIRRNWLKKLTAYVLQYTDILTVRDKESQMFLRELGLSEEKILLTADAVFLLPQIGLDDGKVLLNRHGVDTNNKNIIGVAVRSWDNDKYLGALVDALDALADEGNRVFLIPFQYSADIVIARKVQHAMRHDAKILEREYSSEELLSLIGNLKLLVGMRLHSLIFASVMGVPFVALDYDPKVESFVNMVNGTTAGNIDKLTQDGIVQACKQAVVVTVNLHELHLQSEKNNEIVSKLLEGGIINC
ncbi:MAG: polysaccharide pyruvyl transferase CsaB [Phascolarctobacterium sp.]|nr:polysaccharide pyruvyl transferase CsaB [Candidatus Phascolarctobacterium caballi]